MQLVDKDQKIIALEKENKELLSSIGEGKLKSEKSAFAEEAEEGQQIIDTSGKTDAKKKSNQEMELKFKADVALAN